MNTYNPENPLSKEIFSVLKETTSFLHGCSEEYAIIGGWCPLARFNALNLHPGTRDVDILFAKGATPGSLKTIIEYFISEGYVISAKHEFQLFKVVTIQDRKFAINIDFLHPEFGNETPELFVDHLDIDINNWQIARLKSVVQRNSQRIFTDRLYGEFEFNGHTFNLINGTGLFVTKYKSAQGAKRQRDSLDLYLAHQSNGIDYAYLKKFFRPEVEDFRDWLMENTETFNKNIQTYLKAETDYSQIVLEALS